MARVAGVSCWACGAATLSDDRYPDQGLAHCPACGLRFVAERSPLVVRELYAEDYFARYAGGAYEADPAQRRHEARMRVRWLRRRVGSGELLEVGAAGGWFLAAARDAGFAVSGIEPSAEMAARARQRFGVEVRAAFLEDAELAPGALDVVCAWHVLEHLPEPLERLRTLGVALRPGGTLALEVPNVESRQAHRLGPLWPHLDFAHHVAHYAPASLRALLGRAGFGDVRIETLAGSDYHRPGVALRPAMVAGALRAAVTGGGVPRRSHPSRGELLRATAVV